MVQSLSEIHRVCIVKPQDIGPTKYQYAGKFALHDNQITILEDNLGLVSANIPDGPITPRVLQAIAALKRSAYIKIVSEQGLQEGEEPDLIDRLGDSDGIPAPVILKTPETVPPQNVFHYHRVGMDSPQTLESIDGRILLNGNELASDELEQIISNVENGTASLRYPPKPINERIIKMEELIEDLSKAETSIRPALKDLRNAARSGHLSPETLKAITQHMFVDSMVPGVGNKHAYRDFLLRTKKGYHVRIDANDFGGINKEHGFETGDGAIRALGGALRSSMDSSVGQKHGKLFRIGGDEFHAFVPTHEHAAKFLREARSQLDSIPPINGTHNLSISAGIGPSTFHAEKSLIAAKNAKKSMAYLPGQARTHVHSNDFGHIPLDTEQPPLVKPIVNTGQTEGDVATGMPIQKSEDDIKYSHRESQEGEKFPHYHVEAHLNGKRIGNARFKPRSKNKMYSIELHVDPEHRRKGIASKMYDYARNRSGKEIEPSKDQTDDGKAFSNAYWAKH